MTSRVEKAEPILALLRKHESEAAAAAQGVPNAFCVVYSGIPANHRPQNLLTTYTVGEVIEWQRFVVAKGARSSAAGAYQIIRKTLLDLGLPETERFDEAGQDDAAMILLDRRGWADCEAGHMTPIDFADMLAREWASMPVQRDQRGARRQVKRGQSYYEGDDLNKAGATPEEVMTAINAALGGTPVIRPVSSLEARVAALEAWAEIHQQQECRMTALVRQPTKAPMRKIATTFGLGSIASAAFAAAPALIAFFPPLAPVLAAAQVLVPMALPAVAYNTKEWDSGEQASGAPLRKVTIMAVVGSVAGVIFAAEPQIVQVLPQLGPIIEAAKVLLPALLGPLGYSVKEWTPTAPTPIAGPLPAFKRG